MRDAVIVDAVRTPIGRRNGSLKDVHPVDLSAHVLTSLLARNGLDPALIEDVIWGCVTQISDQSSNVGRLAVLAAGWPETIPGTTIDRACGSSQQAIHFAAAGVAAGHYDIVIAGGVESMSRVPIGSARAVGEPYGPRVQGAIRPRLVQPGRGRRRDRPAVEAQPHPTRRVRPANRTSEPSRRPTAARSTTNSSPSRMTPTCCATTKACGATRRWPSSARSSPRSPTMV